MYMMCRQCSSRRFPWKRLSVPVAASIREASSSRNDLIPVWGGRLNQNSLSGTLSAATFYSDGRNHKENLKESNSLPSEHSLSTDITPDQTSSEQRQRRSPFLELLHQCGSPSDVLDLTCKYSPTIHQVSNCLNHMWSSMKKMSDGQRCYELQLMFEHPEFENLLQRAMRSVQHMCNDDVAYSLLSMVNLGVPQRSRVIQTFLRTCQERLNDFDEKTLSILASALEHMKDGQNVDALKEGMRLVVEVRLPGIKNVLALQTMMRLLGKDAPKELKQKLERKALSMTDQFSLPNVQYMISTMAKMGFQSKPLLKVCGGKIKENLNGIPFNRLYNVLKSCKELLYRDVDLLTSISDHVASTLDIWTNKQLVFFLSVFEDLLFCPTSLMEAYSEKVITNSEALTLKDLLCVLKVYSSLNYDLQHQRQKFLDSLSHALSSYLSKMSGLELLKAVYCLCLLNHFPSALLEQLLNISMLEQLASAKLPKSTERMFQRVDLCLRLDRPPLPQPLTVPSSALGNPILNSPTVNLRLSKGLQSVLADQANAALQEMLVVENFYIIDGVIIKPLPNPTCAMETSSISPAESSQRIAVIYAPNSSFCYGTSIPRGPLALKVRHLKILGYTPVLVTEQHLQPLSEEERTDIIRGLIFPEHASKTRPHDVEHVRS
ncbi:FAST kinase domain-containing protein 2, mitochondrial [Girardinichthys multiradiatus]|uniref:FAST kinase domain-containing protein 2, mitochondrial n=1 Tax=Girardinichthys multiradiatus TaxID=208333 RepID=UPI001FAE2E32|nr:FAST kinase domain-containing protein 2, mitochondrial [Girardinichthys multiradiatus]